MQETVTKWINAFDQEIVAFISGFPHSAIKRKCSQCLVIDDHAFQSRVIECCTTEIGSFEVSPSEIRFEKVGVLKGCTFNPRIHKATFKQICIRKVEADPVFIKPFEMCSSQWRSPSYISVFSQIVAQLRNHSHSGFKAAGGIIFTFVATAIVPNERAEHVLYGLVVSFWVCAGNFPQSKYSGFPACYVFFGQHRCRLCETVSKLSLLQQFNLLGCVLRLLDGCFGLAGSNDRAPDRERQADDAEQQKAEISCDLAKLLPNARFCACYIVENEPQAKAREKQNKSAQVDQMPSQPNSGWCKELNDFPVIHRAFAFADRLEPANDNLAIFATARRSASPAFCEVA